MKVKTHKQILQVQKEVEKKNKDLTFKQRLWLAEYIANGGNATQAAAKAYGLNLKDSTDYNSASVIGWENVKKLDIKEIMEKVGLGLLPLLAKTREGLDATKLYTTKDEAIEHPDYQARAKFLEIGLKLQKQIGNENQVTINQQFNWDNGSD